MAWEWLNGLNKPNTMIPLKSLSHVYCMGALLDAGLEITGVSEIGPDHEDKSYVVLQLLLPLQTVAQHEIGKFILSKYGIDVS